MICIKNLIIASLMSATLFTYGFAREVTITGTVVDSLTSQPVVGAQIAVMTGTVSDTIQTETDGKFSGKVEVRDMVTEIYVTVRKEGYLPTYSPVAVDTASNSADCGTMKVQSFSIGIKTKNNFSSSLGIPASVKVFSVKGKLLYAGPYQPVNKKTWARNFNLQPLIIQYHYKGGNTQVRKIIIGPN